LVSDRKQNRLLTQIGSLLFFQRYNDVNSLVPESNNRLREGSTAETAGKIDERRRPNKANFEF
jgi:hypothetical protein